MAMYTSSKGNLIHLLLKLQIIDITTADQQIILSLNDMVCS